MVTKEQLINQLFGLPENAPDNTVMTKEQALILANEYAKVYHEFQSRKIISENGFLKEYIASLKKKMIRETGGRVLIIGEPSPTFFSVPWVNDRDFSKLTDLSKNMNDRDFAGLVFDDTRPIHVKIPKLDFLQTPKYERPIKELLKAQSKGELLTKEEKDRCTLYAQTKRKSKK